MNIAAQQGLNSLRETIALLSVTDALAALRDAFPGAVTCSTSFSNEDQVITDHISRIGGIHLFTLDTGRLFPETYQTWSNTLEYYGMAIEAYFPESSALESYLQEHGPNGFYLSADNRKACCTIRKVNPLKRALQGKKVWITGLRAEHSPEREDLEQLEWDAANQLIKYHPLLHWTTAEVTAYIHKHRLPYNVLHDRGFASIGCAPCTRALRAGEVFRAGRWWWEDTGKKECGLHTQS